MHNKFRNERRKVADNAVDDYRQKYGRQSRKRTAVEDCTGADVLEQETTGAFGKFSSLAILYAFSLSIVF